MKPNLSFQSSSGGTALAQLNASNLLAAGPARPDNVIYGLVRDEEQASQVEALGFESAVFSLDDFNATVTAIRDLKSLSYSSSDTKTES